MGKVLLVLLAVGLTIYALFDVITTARKDVPMMHKWLWLLAVLIPVVGPLGWLIVSRRAGRPEPRVTGPDDDPDFLRGLRPRRPGPTDDSVQRWEDELRGDADR